MRKTLLLALLIPLFYFNSLAQNTIKLVYKNNQIQMGTSEADFVKVSLSEGFKVSFESCLANPVVRLMIGANVDQAPNKADGFYVFTALTEDQQKPGNIKLQVSCNGQPKDFPMKTDEEKAAIKVTYTNKKIQITTLDAAFKKVSLSSDFIVSLSGCTVNPSLKLLKGETVMQNPASTGSIYKLKALSAADQKGGDIQLAISCEGKTKKIAMKTDEEKADLRLELKANEVQPTNLADLKKLSLSSDFTVSYTGCLSSASLKLLIGTDEIRESTPVNNIYAFDALDADEQKTGPIKLEAACADVKTTLELKTDEQKSDIIITYKDAKSVRSTTDADLKKVPFSAGFTVTFSDCPTNPSLRLLLGDTEKEKPTPVDNIYTFKGINADDLKKDELKLEALCNGKPETFLIRAKQAEVKADPEIKFTFSSDKINRETSEEDFQKISPAAKFTVRFSGCDNKPSVEFFVVKDAGSKPPAVDNVYKFDGLTAKELDLGAPTLKITCNGKSEEFKMNASQQAAGPASNGTQEPKIKLAFNNNKIVLEKPDETSLKTFQLESSFTVSFLGCDTKPSLTLIPSGGTNQSPTPNADKIYSFSRLSDTDRKAKDVKLEASCGDVKATFVLMEPTGGSTITAGQFDQPRLKSLYNKLLLNPRKRYDRMSDEAFILLDEKASIVGAMPVNLDSDDFISILIRGEASKIDKYIVRVEGEYNTNDLEIQNAEKPASAQAGGNNEKATEIVVRRIDIGWHTDEVTVSILRENGNNDPIPVNEFTLKINKLYNITFSASMIKSYLKQPKFELADLANGGKTIQEIVEYKPYITFSAIFYWYRFDKNKGFNRKQNFLTGGRDILKEPVSFLAKINPMVGVAIDRNIKENLFLGLTYQFAKGGLLVAGRHFGMVKSLVDKDFTLGTSTFSGTSNDDIKTKSDLRSEWYVGVSLDLRVFNKLFN